jgi:hypothetical protein
VLIAAAKGVLKIRVGRQDPRKEESCGRERRDGPIRDERRCMALGGDRYREEIQGAFGTRWGYQLNDVIASQRLISSPQEARCMMCIETQSGRGAMELISPLCSPNLAHGDLGE